MCVSVLVYDNIREKYRKILEKNNFQVFFSVLCVNSEFHLDNAFRLSSSSINQVIFSDTNNSNLIILYNRCITKNFARSLPLKKKLSSGNKRVGEMFSCSWIFLYMLTYSSLCPSVSIQDIQ